MLVLAAAFAVAGALPAHASAGIGAPAIWSDHPDYAPGATVTLNGDGWGIGELVHINVNDSAGSTWSRDVDVTADFLGNVTDQFVLPDWFIASYSVTATGPSGTATTTFTDGNVKFDVAPSGSRATFVETVYTNSTTCAAGATVKGGFPKTLTNIDKDTVGVGNSESVRLDASATTTDSPTRSFQAWSSSDSPASPFTVISGTTNLSVCIPGFQGNGSRNYVATYGNSAPTIARDNTSVAVNEGQTALNTGTWSDANPVETVTLTASVGTVTKSGTNASGTWSWSFDTTDGPAQSQTVTITATDSAGLSTSTTFALTVNNVAPTATFPATLTVNEGTSSSFAFTSASDPSSADTSAGFHYAFSCAGASLASATYAGSGTASSVSCSFDDGPSSSTVRARIIDKDGGFTEYTTAVTVDNVAPTATFPATRTVNEGSSSVFAFTSPSDPSSADSSAGFHYAYSCTGASLATATYAGSGTASSVSCSLDDGPSSPTVRARIIDKDGGFTEYTTAVTVDNVAPTGSFPATRTVNEGSSSSFAFTGQFDPSSADTSAGFHYAFSCSGASLGSATYAGSGTASSVSCSFDDGPSASTVRARIIDKDGGFTEYTTAVTVDNVAPTGSFPATRTVNEGSSSSFAFTGQFDPSSADTSAGFHYAFSCSGASLASATYAGSGTAASASCSFDDGPSTPTVRARIIDKDGGFTEYTTAVTVDNVAPTASFSNNGPVDEGSSFTLTLSNGDDVSSADKAAKFTFAFDCGDGSGYGLWTSPAALSASSSCATDDNGSRAVKAKIRDKDGGEREYTATVAVSNVAPTATFSNNGPVDEGSSFSLSMDDGNDVSSVDKAAKFEFAFDCGDGSGYGDWSSPAALSASATCATSDNGSRAVKGKIRDKDGGVSEYTGSVSVNNVAPTVSFTGGPTSPSEDKNGSELYSFSVSDPGNDGFTVKSGFPDCGTGGSFVTGSLATTASGGSFRCRFSDGPASPIVRMQVRDADEPAGSSTADSNIATRNVSVSNVAPTVNLSGPDTANEGEMKTYTFTVSDPGDDTFSFVAGPPTDYPTCGAYGELVGTPTVAGGSFQCRFPDGPHTTDVAIKIKDDDGGVSSPDVEQVDIIAVAIANVAPSVTAPADQSSDEGENKSFSLGSFSDPGPDSPWAVDVNWGDGSPNTTFTETAAGPVTARTITAQSHAYNDNGAYTVTVKVTDNDDEFGSKTFTVNVANVAPTASFSNNGPVDEGSSFTLSLTDGDDVSSADKAAKFTFAFDCGDGSGYGSWSSPAALSASASCPTTDNGSRAVKGKVRDKDGGFTEYTATVAVNNVAPTGTFSNNGPVDEGSSFSLTMSDGDDVSSADKAAKFTFAFDCGDGSGYSAFSASPALSATASCPTSDNGSRAVGAKIRDKDGGVREYTDSVTVNNVAPSATFNAPDEVNEGSDINLSLTDVQDPGSADTHQYRFSCDGGATWSAYSNANTDSCPTSDNGTKTVKGQVRDDDGGESSEYSKAVTVKNVAPSATFNAPDEVNEGSDINVSLTNVQDPGTGDTHEYRFSCNGGTTWTAYGSSSTHSCPTSDNGTKAVKGQVRDDDGGESVEYSKDVTVKNVAPSVNLSGPLSANEGDLKSYSYSWTDPGSDDTFPAADHAVSCGPKGTVSDDVFTPASKSGSFKCTFRDDSGAGTFAVSATVKDDDGGSGSDTKNVDVDNVAPAVALTGPTSANEGDTKSYSYSWTDQGSDDTFPVAGNSVDCGPKGTASDAVFTPASKTGSFKCTFSDDSGVGTFAVKATVTDDDGGVGSDTKQVTVGNVAPQVTVTSPAFGALYAKPATVAMSASFTDAGKNDTHTCSFTWDDGTSSAGTVAETPGSGSGTCSGAHTYNTAGVYTIKVTVTDDDGASTTVEWMVVVYDPSAGFVTGGGWIDVAGGSYPADPTPGRANFGFTSKYKNGASTPTGETEFNFQVASFKFHSTSYQWLVVSGFKAQYKGTGQVNGASGYDFRLTAYDGQLAGAGNTGKDRFRIKITRQSTGEVVFDNRLGKSDDMDQSDPQEISGGSIVIHKA